VLRFIRDSDLVVMREVTERFKISKRQALKILRKLIGEGKIEQVGIGIWRIRKRFWEV
jgi:predicted HTH transcriptional regulator